MARDLLWPAPAQATALCLSCQEAVVSALEGGQFCSVTSSFHEAVFLENILEVVWRVGWG